MSIEGSFRGFHLTSPHSHMRAFKSGDLFFFASCSSSLPFYNTRHDHTTTQHDFSATTLINTPNTTRLNTAKPIQLRSTLHQITAKMPITWTPENEAKVRSLLLPPFHHHDHRAVFLAF